MALPILDGNQSAATLSTIITGGAHIPAHTVVSLGSQAISDITSGVSGSVVSISNFPASQGTTFGAITGSVSVLNFPASQSVTFTQASVTFGATTGSVSILNFPSTQTISGTVTANAFGYDSANSTNRQIPILPYNEAVEGMEPYVVPVQISNTFGVIQTGNPLPISGTVTANVFGSGFLDQPYAVPVMIDGGDSVTRGLNIGFHEDLTADEFRTVKASEPFPVQIRKGTVTIGANPSGALTTRFGSVTTANTAQITSAVTNTNRKYLLAQNISAGTVTIGIGFSPTTTQGIQLTAGAGLTFDAFCPTEAVYWLGAVTGAAFTILEG